MANRVEPVPTWEKSGNVSWVECQHCNGWVPVDPKLIATPEIQMVCPHCAGLFRDSEASPAT
jgi:hypothetical protein